MADDFSLHLRFEETLVIVSEPEGIGRLGA